MISRRRAPVAIAGMALPLILASTAFGAGSHTVTTTADTIDARAGDGTCADAAGQCSLRAAIQEANASPRAATIRLQSGATYTLSIAGAGEDASATGDLDVTGRLTIRGERATVNAAGIDRAFDVADGARLTVERLAVTGGTPEEGADGGAYRSAGKLELKYGNLYGNSVVGASAEGRGASGGAVANEEGWFKAHGTVMKDNSSVRAGGAIEATAGRTILQRVRLMDNTTGPMPGNGGGLHLTGEGVVKVERSIVTGNTAASEGGGLWNSSSGRMMVRATIVDRNTASGAEADTGGGGIFNDGGTLSVKSSPIRDNVADGAAGSGGGIFNNEGRLTLKSSTLSGNTATRAGGAIEARVGMTHLHRVTLKANATGAAPGNGGGLHITDPEGNGTVKVERSLVRDNTAANEGGGLWNHAGKMTVVRTVFVNNTASGAAADNGGGAIFNNGGTLTTNHTVVINNTADGAAGSGGGILNKEGDVKIVRTRFNENSAMRAGGAIEAVAGTTRLYRAAMTENSAGPAPGNGGGLHLTGAGTVKVMHTVARKNTATAEGGGLWNSAAGTMTISRSVIRDNVASGADADQGGGGLFNDGADGSGGTLEVFRSVVLNNVADGAAGSGGGILNNQGILKVERSRIDGNRSMRAGGGIEANIGTTDLDRTVLIRNTTGAAPGNGGGFHLTGAGTVKVDRSQVLRNDAAAEGGGLWNSATGTMRVTRSNVRDNTAPDGPNLFNDGGTFTVDGRDVPVR